MSHAIINLFIISVSFKFVEQYKYVLFDSTNNKLDSIDEHWTYMPYCYTFHRDTLSVLTTSAIKNVSVG